MLKPHHEHASEFLEIYMQSRVDLRSYTTKMAKLTKVEHVSVYQMEPDYYYMNFLVSNKKLKTTDVTFLLLNKQCREKRFKVHGDFVFRVGVKYLFQSHSKGIYKHANDCMNHPE